MRMVALTLLGVFLVGCESKHSLLTKVEIKETTIPEAYFHINKIDLNRDIITDEDVSIFMLDLYRGYNECIINLEAIKEINNRKE